MLHVDYNLNVGTWSVNSADDPRTELNRLETSLSLNSPNDTCGISVYAPPSGSLAGQTTQAAGALGLGGEGGAGTFSVQVRGDEIQYGDPITIELTSGEVSDKVMTAEVASIISSFSQTKITGRTGMQKLANTCLNQVYENQSLRQIVNDLAGQAEVDMGEIETGSTYPYFVVNESKNLLKYIRELAMREGMDLYFDTDNKLTLKKFSKSSADHIFRFGAEILDLQIASHQPAHEHVLASGESPASNQGSDTWHWIAKDLSPFQSEVGQGAKTLAIQDGVLRTKDAADSLATAKLGVIKDSSTWGRLKILGNPRVKLADAIAIRDAQKPELNGLFKVTSVRHVFNKQQGYLTFIGFTRFGSAGGGLPGGLG